MNSDANLPAENLFVRRSSRLSVSAEVVRPSVSYWQDARSRLFSSPVAVASLIYIALLIVIAAVVPEFIPYAYDEQEIWNKHAVPSLGEEALVMADEGSGYSPVRIEAHESSAESSAESSVDSVAVVDAPPAPTGLVLMGEPTTMGVAFKWLPVPGVDGYRIYRSISGDTLGLPIEDLDAGHLSFEDNSSLSAQAAYYYFVVAFNAFGDSTEPAQIVVRPRFALPFSEAKKLQPSIQVGQTLLTRPHYLGTDYLGRDLLARVLMGARISLFIGIVVPLLYMLIGILYGSISGYLGGLVDEVMMRAADVVATVPELLLVILLQVVMGSGLATLVIALVAGSWSRSARQIRGEVLRLKELEFVHAAKVLGTGTGSIILRHLLPNVMGTVLVLLTVGVPYAIFSEAFLSFIGLGIEPPMASWGVVAKEGARVFQTYPHELLIPSLFICLTMLAFNLFGDGLRDALDPKLRGTR